MSVPDVTVVLPVYNTMPYLRRCLASLSAQSIGAGRMQVVAVDDGSTDGSGRELRRFARRHPHMATVIHQANSGGPAAPCNRALERARGRYVFFLGADDFLGPEALERLVAAADSYGSDVVLGRMVGVHNRYVHQAAYARTEPDVDLVDSGLAWTLSNTKLFRRDLIERHGLRFPEDMPLYSDQPFTLAALVYAARISVLADYDYYHAVRRLNARNITFRSRHEDRLRAVRGLIGAVTELLEPGKQRDAILLRHFSWEIAKLIEDDFLRLDPRLQESVRATVADLAARHLNDDIRAQLDVETRLRIAAAGAGLAELVAVIGQDARHGVPATVTVDDRWYAGYPGVVDGTPPDARFDVTDAAAHWLAKLDVTALAWGRSDTGAPALAVTARSPRPDLPATASTPVRVCAGPLDAETVAVTPDASGCTLRLRFPVAELLAGGTPRGARHVLRARVDARGASGSARLRAPGVRAPVRLVRLHRARPYLITVAKDHAGHLVIAIAPVTPRRVLARLLDRGPRDRRKKA